MLPRRQAIALFTGALAGGAVRPALAVRQPQHDLALVDAITWGANQSSMSAFRSLGRDHWVQSQLHPPAQDRLPAAAPRTRSTRWWWPGARRSTFAADFDAAARVANEIADADQRAAAQKSFQEALSDMARQAAAASILRALYSPDQLRERMTWFWFNHFQRPSVQSKPARAGG